MDDCIFCAIVSGDASASIVYADDVAVAFLDISPVNAGHLLVVPRRHVATLAGLDVETGAHLFIVATRMAQAIRHSGVRCEGINLFLADGEAAFQEVFHVHLHVTPLHVIPRFAGDAFRIVADWTTPPGREELDAAAAQIRDVNHLLHDAPRLDLPD